MTSMLHSIVGFAFEIKPYCNLAQCPLIIARDVFRGVLDLFSRLQFESIRRNKKYSEDCLSETVIERIQQPQRVSFTHHHVLLHSSRAAAEVWKRKTMVEKTLNTCLRRYDDTQEKEPERARLHSPAS